jgi:hypothetical protein
MGNMKSLAKAGRARWVFFRGGHADFPNSTKTLARLVKGEWFRSKI